MSETWDPDAHGVLRLPSGRLVRGRGLRYPLPEGPVPALGVYLLGKEPPEVPWNSDWIRWPDFRLPSDPALAAETLRQALDRAGNERVEVACGGGRGRTGTALACIAVLDGVPGDQAVEFVRRGYHRRAVETPWQRRYVSRFTGPANVTGPDAPGLDAPGLGAPGPDSVVPDVPGPASAPSALIAPDDPDAPDGADSHRPH